jgi:hypothetical protein
MIQGSFGAAMVIAAMCIACGDYGSPMLDVQSSDPGVAARARAKMRAQGPAGLDRLLRVYDAAVKAGRPEESLNSLRDAVSVVAGQKDAHVSRLFWHTDMELAKAAARESGKPILSLRLLGRLDEEYSCANSRFFRTTLYSNEAISRELRERFVLHWQSVRPVPRITIDMGDGRRIERTITGNSIHYVLDAEGRTVDALPGLYGPAAFLRVLREAHGVAVESGRMQEGSERQGLVRRHHEQMLDAIYSSWESDLARGGVKATRETLRKSTSDDQWVKFAALHRDEARLDDSSRQLIVQKRPTAVEAGALAKTKMVVEDPMARMLRRLENSIAEDTVRNEYLMRTKILEWLMGNIGPGVDALNIRVYAELFLMPPSDPWLGLAPGDAFTALPSNGLVAK